jgi:hypothetical protein
MPSIIVVFVSGSTKIGPLGNWALLLRRWSSSVNHFPIHITFWEKFQDNYGLFLRRQRAISPFHLGPNQAVEFAWMILSAAEAAGGGGGEEEEDSKNFVWP